MTLAHQARRAEGSNASRSSQASVEATALAEVIELSRALGASSEDVVAFRMRNAYNANYYAGPERPFDDLRALGTPNWIVRMLTRVRRRMLKHTST